MGWRDTTLTIANAGTESPVLDLTENKARHRITLLIISPAAVTGTITIHVAKTTTGTFGVLQSAGADVNLTAGDATIIDLMTAGALKIVGSAAQAAARVFDILGAAASETQRPA